jgi:polyhydroxyalkanoate synthase
MNAPAGLDLASIPERIQSEVQRAIQRSIKGVEYFSTSGRLSDRRRRTFCMPAAP